MWWMQNRRPKEWAVDPKAARITIDLSAALNGAEGLAHAMAQILGAMGRGEISPGQAAEFARVVEVAGSSLERNTIANEVKLLEGPK